MVCLHTHIFVTEAEEYYVMNRHWGKIYDPALNYLRHPREENHPPGLQIHTYAVNEPLHMNHNII